MVEWCGHLPDSADELLPPAGPHHGTAAVGLAGPAADFNLDSEGEDKHCVGEDAAHIQSRGGLEAAEKAAPVS